jgi:hypothetical protein
MGGIESWYRMLLLCHLCIGAVLGLLLFRVTGDRNFGLLAVVGSLLPDLVDKPVGYLLYGDVLGHGRLYLHTLLFLLLLSSLGLLVSRLSGSRYGTLAAGFSGLHQVMDLMWLTPVTWFYPFLGAFPTEMPVDLGAWFLALEVGSLSEWVFLGVLLLVALSTWKGDRFLPWGSLALVSLGVAALAWPSGPPLHILADEVAGTGPMLALASLTGSLCLWFVFRRVPAGGSTS